MHGMDFLILLLPPLVLFFVGYLVRFRKMYWLISGYNTMSAEKKKKVDTENLGILIGNMCFILGGIMFLGFLLINLEVFSAAYVVFAMFFLVIIYTIITAQKYDGTNFNNAGEMKTSSKVVVAIIVVLLLALFGFIGSKVYKEAQPVIVNIEQGSLHIDGSYGQNIPIDDIVEIQLIDSLPEIQRRTNGSETGYMLRGHFQLSEIGQAMLYLDRQNPPFIYLATSEQKVYLNGASPQETRELFAALSEEIKN
jgi:hypothetical protein